MKLTIENFNPVIKIKFQFSYQNKILNDIQNYYLIVFIFTIINHIHKYNIYQCNFKNHKFV